MGPCEDSGILEVTGRKGSPGAVGEGLGLWAVASGQDSSRWRVSALPCPCGVLDTTVKSGLVLPPPSLGHKRTGLQPVFPPPVLATWGAMVVSA